MSTTLHKIQIPSIEDFGAEYYFQNSTDKQPPRVFPPHIHDTIEFYVLIDGNVSFMVENVIYKMSKGDIVMSKPNEIHNCIINADSIHKHLCLWFNPSCNFLFSDFLNHDFAKGNLISPSESDKEKLATLYLQLSKSTEEKDEKARFVTLLDILQIFEKNMASDYTLTNVPHVLSEILNEINKNFTSITSLNYFTDKYFISQSTLNRLFKHHLHTSPKMYLETKKLAYSRMLLKEGMPVADACALAGFSDYSNFIRLFRLRFGITPNKYRKK